MFSGSIPALVTPFRDGAVDEAAFRRLVDWQITEGSSALVPCGTTGESATLSYDEHYRVIELCVEAAAGRVPADAGGADPWVPLDGGRPRRVQRLRVVPDRRPAARRPLAVAMTERRLAEIDRRALKRISISCRTTPIRKTAQGARYASLTPASVSLYPTSVRYAVLVPSMLGS